MKEAFSQGRKPPIKLTEDEKLKLSQMIELYQKRKIKMSQRERQFSMNHSILDLARRSIIQVDMGRYMLTPRRKSKRNPISTTRFNPNFLKFKIRPTERQTSKQITMNKIPS